MTEQVPDGEIFRLMLTWSRAMMESPHFETLVDRLLQQAKKQIMQTYRDHHPAPTWLPSEEEES